MLKIYLNQGVCVWSQAAHPNYLIKVLFYDNIDEVLAFANSSKNFARHFLVLVNIIYCQGDDIGSDLSQLVLPHASATEALPYTKWAYPTFVVLRVLKQGIIAIFEAETAIFF